MSTQREKKKKVVSYWEKNLYKTHGMSEIDMGCDFSEAVDRCWRCGYETSRTEICHIKPKGLLPKNIKEKFDPSNLVLLCNPCHKEAPDIYDSEIMWKWIQSTSYPTHEMYSENRISEEYKKLYGISFFEDLHELFGDATDKWVEHQKSKEYNNIFKQKMEELYENYIGTHSGDFSWSTRAVARRKMLEWQTEYFSRI